MESRETASARFRGFRNGSSSGGDRDHLAALVKSARGTHPMGNVRSRTLGTGAQLGQGQDTVISPALAHAASRWFAFRDTHNSLAFKFSVCSIQPRRMTPPWSDPRRRFFSSYRQFFSATRCNQLCTTDVAETQGAYL